MLNSFNLKVIAIVSMVLDHIYTYINGPTGNSIPIWFGYLGKIAAPIFFYLIVEGFYHTRDRGKYLSRLVLFGALMFGVDSLLGIQNNIFLSLACSVAIMMGLEYVKKGGNKSKGIIFTIIMSVVILFTEASGFGLFMTYIFYFFRDKKLILSLTYILFSLSSVILTLGQPNFYDQIFLYDYGWMMVFALPLILLYNGKLGIRNKFVKWMFYIFYPLHLIIIVLISRFCF
ncbi:TraX family protein [Clostridium chrysemydis]|uniref:TraX family protein n=1 Tax=Clostridium chrysemydis TaxID=2665504 RepID=UPI0018836A98